LFATALLAIWGGAGDARAQQSLPTIEIGASRNAAARRAVVSRTPASRQAAPAAPVQQAQTEPSPREDRRTAFQDRPLPKTGANVSSFSRAAIDALPQGDNLPLDKILLRAPGVTQDSAANGGLHVRNEHSNLQYRIDGVLLPDGVSGLGQVIETGFIESVSLVTGALPAQYGLRTSGLIDIISRAPPPTPSGNVSLYGGSRDTAQTAFDFGLSDGKWRVFAAGRLLTNNLGIENPTRSHEAIHDRTRQGRFFGHATYNIDDATRISFLTGTSVGKFQIPNNTFQPPEFTAFGLSSYDSARLNANQIEHTHYNVLALRKSEAALDAQLSLFSRYSSLHFTPDPLGDLIFNGVASDVFRSSFVNGAQGDAAYRPGFGHILRAGFLVSADSSHVVNSSLLFPLDADGEPIDAAFGVRDANRKLGWLYSLYAQDEWRLTDRLRLNAGLRFDHAVQFVRASQLGPRVGVEYEPFEGTTLHAGYARYFSPPWLVQSALPNLPLVQNTTQQPEIPFTTPARPERSHYVDIGVMQRFTPRFEAGVSAYFKRARNLLDNGQFGRALALNVFNYDRAYNAGVEFKARYANENFSAYANFAIARQRGRQIISNFHLFEADELLFVANNYIYTDHAQTWNGSAGASYSFWGTRLSADVILGAGLRRGFANTGRLPAYAQVNLGLSREFSAPWGKPMEMRFDVVNLLDHDNLLRDGSGNGVAAPQFGPRRGFYVGLGQTF
jgi:outer membrane receptor protein involved in Fe transport